MSSADDSSRGGEMSNDTEYDADYDANYAETRETTEGRVYTVTGGDWDELLVEKWPATSGSSSTWGRSTRRRTACCGWCWSWRARPSPRPGR